MPIYEYQCKKCGKFETMQKITDAALSRCPTCRGKVTKLISSTSFQLKGSGWYITDYGRKGAGSKESGPPSGDATAEKSASTVDAQSKSDAKPSSEPKPKPETKSTSKEATAA